VDFFTPIVDDPFVFGQIAAANALSDVYAMGGRALTALAIAGFPRDADRGLLKAIFAGGVDVLGRAEVALLGGHTVQDPEIHLVWLPACTTLMNELVHLGVFGYVYGVSCDHPCIDLVSLPPFIAQIEKALVSMAPLATAMRNAKS
jgi:hypothetical protein